MIKHLMIAKLLVSVIVYESFELTSKVLDIEQVGMHILNLVNTSIVPVPKNHRVTDYIITFSSINL